MIYAYLVDKAQAHARFFQQAMAQRQLRNPQTVFLGPLAGLDVLLQKEGCGRSEMRTDTVLTTAPEELSARSDLHWRAATFMSPSAFLATTTTAHSVRLTFPSDRDGFRVVVLDVAVVPASTLFDLRS